MENLVEEKVSKVIKFDLDVNKKQKEFFNEVMKSVNGESNKKYFFYGGAIRGGKTSVCLFILHYLACEYTGFRAHVIRANYPNLDYVINSFKSLFGESTNIKAVESKFNRYIEYKNGSRIHFISENYSNDKDSSFLKGLETNVIMLDQMEELQESTFKMAIRRVGSHNIPNTTNRLPIILGNFNPTYNWIKTEIYDKYKNNTLNDESIFIESLPIDNPYVCEAQFNSWKELGEDSIDYRRYVLGEWGLPFKSVAIIDGKEFII